LVWPLKLFRGDIVSREGVACEIAIVAAETLSYRALEDRVVDAPSVAVGGRIEPSSIAGISIADEV